MSQREIKLIECPRDAMQGIKDFIPTQKKIEYINTLLKVGFNTLDFGSFVSPKAIPQLADTSEVFKNLDLEHTKTKLLAIVANERGTEDALVFEEIDYLGYPFSVSETFQKRNTNATIEESLKRLEDIQNLVVKNERKLVLYLSMGFGNPYGDPYHEDVVAEWITKLSQLEIQTFALSDTIGVADPELIQRLFESLIPEFSNLELGAHLHTTPTTWKEKIVAAYDAGCRRFDGALGGYGGCPMAADELTGNMPMENMLAYFDQNGVELNLNQESLDEAMQMASNIFPA